MWDDAALQAEDLFRSLENELNGDRQEEEKKGEEGEAVTVVEEVVEEEEEEPLSVEVLSEAELKKLTGSGPKSMGLRDELRAVGEAVQQLCGHKRPRDTETKVREGPVFAHSCPFPARVMD